VRACAIVTGAAEASVVHSDEHVVAFMDIRPVVPGHLLVVPRRHAVGLADLDPDDRARMFRAAEHLAAALRRSDLLCGGVNLFLADTFTNPARSSHDAIVLQPRQRAPNPSQATSRTGKTCRSGSRRPTLTSLSGLSKYPEPS